MNELIERERVKKFKKSVKYRDKNLILILIAVLSTMMVWTGLEGADNPQMLFLLLLSFVSVLVGLYLTNIHLQVISLLLLNIVFILNSFRFDFSYPSVVQLIAFQTGIIFLFEMFWFSNRLSTFDARTSVERDNLKKISLKFLTSLIFISLLSLISCLGMLYISLQGIIFLPGILIVIVFALVVLICVGVTQFVRKHTYE